MRQQRTKTDYEKLIESVRRPLPKAAQIMHDRKRSKKKDKVGRFSKHKGRKDYDLR